MTISSPVARTPAEPIVLVIEDDPTLRSTLGYNLRREGFASIGASDGEAGLGLFVEHQDQIGLIVLDLMLPRMSGLHVLRNVRQTSRVPVVIVSARGEEQDKIDGLDLGADDYLVKPFAIREMMARVRALLRRSSGEPSLGAAIERGQIRIDTAGRRAWVGTTELDLRPKEYGLLMTLALGAGRVYTRQELLDAIWGEDVIVDERTVDVHVSWLRGKLRRAGLQDDPIRTAYGAGYLFVTTPPAAQTPHSESLRQSGGDVQPGRAARLTIGQPKEYQ